MAARAVLGVDLLAAGLFDGAHGAMRPCSVWLATLWFFNGTLAERRQRYLRFMGNVSRAVATH